jgi:hypothetical protein
MAQNSQRISWTSEEVDNKLKDIMKAAFENGLKNAKEYVPAKEGEFPSLVAGSNIAGFVKVVVSVSSSLREMSILISRCYRRQCTTKATGGKLEHNDSGGYFATCTFSLRSTHEMIRIKYSHTRRPHSGSYISPFRFTNVTQV